MSDEKRFRKLAAQIARQAGEEPDADEASRLLGIAEYWVRLADNEEFTECTKDRLRSRHQMSQNQNP
jgi:hypothetical protein